MSDSISRQLAIDEIEERKYANGYRNVAVISELNRLEGYIMRLPSTEPKWVPVTERLPEEDGYYIVSVKNGLFPNDVIPIDILRFKGGKWKYYFVFENDGFEDDDFEDPITAWMPLPEPYEGGDA